MSFNLESVAARLVPFDMGMSRPAFSTSGRTGDIPTQPVAEPTDAQTGGNGLESGFLFSSQTARTPGIAPRVGPQVTGLNTLTSAGEGTRTFAGRLGSVASGVVPRQEITEGDPLAPIIQTGGLVFSHTPEISEDVGIRYDNTELVHANEGVFTYRNTDNMRIGLGNAVWTCDTYAKARYALAVLHFFRSYSMMDFGRAVNGRKGGSGKPPSPMWFSAYGNYAYQDVPVLLEKYGVRWPVEGDYVGIPNPGTAAASQEQLNFAYGNIGAISQQASGYTWLPMKLEITGIALVVQHSVRYWTHEFSLDDFRSGRMLGRSDNQFGFGLNGPIIGPGGLLGGGT